MPQRRHMASTAVNGFKYCQLYKCIKVIAPFWVAHIKYIKINNASKNIGISFTGISHSIFFSHSRNASLGPL